MKDLKHLIFFEKLLENADNELVRQAQADGGLALGLRLFDQVIVGVLKQVFKED